MALHSSKSALHGMLRWTATRHAKDGITCNAVAPALIDQTGMIVRPAACLKRISS